MDEYRIIALLKKFSVEIVILSLAVYFITLAIKHFWKKAPVKVISLLPFMLSGVFYTTFVLLTKAVLTYDDVITKSISIAGVSTLYSSLFDKIKNSVSDKDDALEYILEAYVSVDSIKEVIKQINSESKEELSEDKVKEIIGAATNLDENKLNLIAEMIVKTTSDKTEKDNIDISK